MGEKFPLRTHFLIREKQFARELRELFRNIFGIYLTSLFLPVIFLSLMPFILRPKKRHQVFRRDGYKCQDCGSNLRLIAHHLCLRKKGGTDSIENLITLCDSCHKKRHPFIVSTEARKRAWKTRSQGGRKCRSSKNSPLSRIARLSEPSSALLNSSSNSSKD